MTAAIVGNLVSQWLDLPHDVTLSYELVPVGLEAFLLIKVAFAALLFGVAAMVFSSVWRYWLVATSTSGCPCH